MFSVIAKIIMLARFFTLTFILFFASLLSAGEPVHFSRAFAPQENWIKNSESRFRREMCLNGTWQFQPMPLPDNWKRASGIEPELPLPQVDDWDETPIKIPSPWNVNTWGGGRDAGTKAHNLYWPDSVYYPSYPPRWETAEMGWLKRSFCLPRSWETAEKRIVLHFEAVAGDCVVMVNGKKVGEHFDKFLPFEFDITEFVNEKSENELLVGIRSHSLFDKQSQKYPKMRATYPPGSEMHRLVGITEDVLLLALPPLCVDDVFVKPLVEQDVLEIEISINNKTKKSQSVDLLISVAPWINESGQNRLDAPEPKSRIGKTVLEFKSGEKTVIPPGKTTIVIKQKINNTLEFWSPETPHLYVMDLRLLSDQQPLDCKQTRFGWREFKIVGKDLLLNGKKIQLFGDLLHPFGPYIHSRRFVWSWYTMIKDFGGNAVRPHAQIHPRHFLDLADEMGIVVLDENSIFGSSIMLNFEEPITWKRYLEHTEGLVLRDRNHPSVVGWSIGNELFAIFQLNDISLPDAENFYAKIVELGEAVRRLDPTREWISCDGDEDIGGRISVWSKHFGHGDSTNRLPTINKPMMVGESGGTYYATAKQLSVFNGDRAYESYAGRNEALGIDVYNNINEMAKPHLVFFSASETAWFGLMPLPFGYTDFSRRPTLEDGVFFAGNFEEGRRGMQPERLPPYVSTLNPGWDESLPIYEPLEMFHAERAAILGKHYEPKVVDKVAIEAITPTVLTTSVQFLGKERSLLRRKLEALGIPFGHENLYLIVDADSLEISDQTEAKKTIDEYCQQGGRVLVFAQQPKIDLKSILPISLCLTERPATMLIPNHHHPWSAGLTFPDLYFAEDGEAKLIMKQGINVLDGTKHETILEASNTDWSLFNHVPEHSKCAAVVLYERMIKPSGKAFLSMEHLKGTLAVCSLDYRIETKSSRRLWRHLFEQMGVVMQEEKTMLLEAINDMENSLVNSIVLGRLTETEAEQALESALKNPPRNKSPFQNLQWQLFKSPSRDRMIFHWIPQNGPKEQFVELCSFWIKSPRSLDDLLADGPDAPRFAMRTYTDGQCDIYLNTQEMRRERSENVDYRILTHWENIPLKKGWNHLLIRVKSQNMETDKPGTLAVRFFSNHSAFLNELDSAVDLPTNVEVSEK